MKNDANSENEFLFVALRIYQKMTDNIFFSLHSEKIEKNQNGVLFQWISKFITSWTEARSYHDLCNISFLIKPYTSSQNKLRIIH
jgi:hypothetical protein